MSATNVSGPKSALNTAKNAGSAAVSAVTNAGSAIAEGFKGLTGFGNASGATVGGSHRRPRNVRGRFLSKKKAARMTMKNATAKAVTVGTKAQVFHGTAKNTSGGLTRKDLMKTKKGRIVSKRKHAAGKIALRRLKAAGYSAKKGTFKLFRK